MKWMEVSVRASHAAADVMAECFKDLGTNGVSMDDPEIWNEAIEEGLWDFKNVEEERPHTDRVTVKAYFPADDSYDEKYGKVQARVREIERIDGLGGACELSVKPVQDEDWADNWKQYFHTQRVGQHFVIQPSWESYAAKPDDVVLRLDPGAAFGTGTHPTTAMCLEAVESLVKLGMTVFDVGTGSGVLAIAAAKLGAAEVVAKDYDALAAKVAAENAAENGVRDVIETGTSDKLQNFEGKADVVLANIIADIIIPLFDELNDHLKPGGRLLASGIIDTREAEVVRAAEQRGFAVEERRTRDGWVALVIGRKEEITR